MRMRVQLAMALSIVLLLPASQLVGQEDPPEPDKASIDALIKDIASPSSAKWQAAHAQLKKLGEQAIPQLSAAALGDDGGIALGSVNILSRYLNSPNTKLKSAAKAALEKIAATKSGLGPEVARMRLAESKARPQPIPGQPIPGQRFPGFPFPGQRFPGFPFPGQPFPGFPQFQGGGTSVRTSKFNGVEKTEVTKPGQTIKINADPNQGIKVEITDTKGEKPVTRKFEAKNVAELKKEHPEAYKLYQQYSQDRSPSKRDVELRLRNLEREIQSIQKRLEGADEDIVPAKRLLGPLKRAVEEIKNARETLQTPRRV